MPDHKSRNNKEDATRKNHRVFNLWRRQLAIIQKTQRGQSRPGWRETCIALHSLTGAINRVNVNKYRNDDPAEGLRMG